MQTSFGPRNLLLFFAALALAALACQSSEPTSVLATEPSEPLQPTAPNTDSATVFDQGRTAFGFFPAPPEGTTEAVLNHFANLGDNADFILIQPAVPWEEFQAGIDGESQERTDLTNQTILAKQNDLDWIFVVDPLNGLNRREFLGLPDEWEANFGNPDVREAYSNLCVVDRARVFAALPGAGFRDQHLYGCAPG